MNIHTLCMQAPKADSPEPWPLADAISREILCTGSFVVAFVLMKQFFSHVRMIFYLSELDKYKAEEKVSCSRTQRRVSSES